MIGSMIPYAVCSGATISMTKTRGLLSAGSLECLRDWISDRVFSIKMFSFNSFYSTWNKIYYSISHMATEGTWHFIWPHRNNSYKPNFSLDEIYWSIFGVVLAACLEVDYSCSEYQIQIWCYYSTCIEFGDRQYRSASSCTTPTKGQYFHRKWSHEKRKNRPIWFKKLAKF